MDSKDISRKERAASVEISFMEFLRACRKRWWWIALSLGIFLSGGLLMILMQQPEYERSEELLIKDQDSGGGIGDISDLFSSFGLVSDNTTVYNELIALKSPAVMQEVVRRLNLDVNYDRKGGMHPVTLYGATLPVIVEMQGIGRQEGASFTMVLHPDGSRTLKDFIRSTVDGREKLDGVVGMSAGEESVKTPVGMVKVTSNPDYTGQLYDKDVEIDVVKSALQSAIEEYCEKLKGDLVDQDADVIGLSIKDVSVERAVDILDMILVVYNENWIEDKNKMAVATSAFIDDRLRLIERELGDVDSNIARYSAKVGSPDLIASAQIALEKEAKLEESVLELANQLELAQYIREFLEDNANRHSIIPVNTGIDNVAIEKDIITYNSILRARNNLAANSSEKNPLVEDYDSQLNGMRESIERSVSNHIAGIKTLMRNVSSERTRNVGDIAGTTEKALPLLSEERQQKVKEGLYLFLLQKREENELSRKFTADNVRIITPPMGSLKPVSPKKKLIMIFAFILGAGIPLAIIYMVATGDTKVRSRNDFEDVGIPFAGEIPQVGKSVEGGNRKFRHRKDERMPLSVVEEGKRDVVNEAFRVIRSNIEFMSGKGIGCQVIMLTSFNPGSGKSFVSYNLGLSFAVKKRQVLLIDCDLRRGSTSMYVDSPGKGLSDYIGRATDDWRGMLKTVGDGNLTIMPIGKMPPNPAELLENGRLQELLEEARGNYDYIILDCPPVNIVADTQIVGQYADRTLFVARAGLLEKGSLAELSEFYKEKRFKNISLILNGTEPTHSRYYTYGNYSGYGRKQ